MKNKKHSQVISKWLSYVLRHNPSSAGLTCDRAGWISVDELLAAASQNGHKITLYELEALIAENDKQRFTFNANNTKVRANQGHSITVDLQLSACVPPAILYHGTTERFAEKIFITGLLPQKRHHVHLSTDHTIAVSVGSRHGMPVVLVVDAKQMQADGHIFFRSENGVWLVDQVPPSYLRRE